MNITFPKATLTDAAVINELSKQLGYENTVADTASYISALNDSDNEELVVAVYQGNIIAWMQLSYILRIESGYFAEITGLVVDERHRSAGIGKMLIEYAKDWCKVKGLSKLKVRTNVVRKRTHRFYERSGFGLRKEQKIYEMNV